MVLVHHDDANREWAYDSKSAVGTFSDALMDEAIILSVVKDLPQHHKCGRYVEMLRSAQHDIGRGFAGLQAAQAFSDRSSPAMRRTAAYWPSVGVALGVLLAVR
jgi:hypothetical protein